MDMGNISPGEPVPQTGTYQCEMCFMSEVSSRINPVLASGLIKTRGRENLGKITTQFFRQGDVFDQCPVCKGATGWTLVEPEPGKTIEESVQERISAFLEHWKNRGS